MSDANLSDEQPLESRRVPLEREVVLEFEQFSSFIREYSANISLKGMFVKTDQPHLPGSVFRFEIRLADDAPLVAGLAKVLWVREEEEAADRPTGMGVRFLELEAEGRGLIERIVREHTARGGEPFRIEEAVEAAVEAGESTPATAEPESAYEPSDQRDRSAVIELPALEDLLEEARAPKTPVTLETPPRGWRPGISVARPRTRPQLMGVIALAAIVVTAVVFLLVRWFGGQPVLDRAETVPPALPQAEAPPADAAEPPLPPFTAVEEITWQRAGAGAEIVVRLDGSLPDGSWSIERLSDPPRHLLKLQGASRPYPTETYEVGIGGVRQLRTGYRDGAGGNEQQVLIDLVDPRVVLDESLVEGATLRLRFRRLNR